MKRILPSSMVIFTLIFAGSGCTKNTDPEGDRTIANIVGTYQLTGFTKTIENTTYNTFDTLSACKKDNLIRFNTDMTVNFIDAGIPCSFSTNRSGTWYLQGDNLYLDGDALVIKNFNGKTLALSTISAKDPGVTNFTTWVKK